MLLLGPRDQLLEANEAVVILVAPTFSIHLVQLPAGYRSSSPRLPLCLQKNALQCVKSAKHAKQGGPHLPDSLIVIDSPHDAVRLLVRLNVIEELRQFAIILPRKVHDGVPVLSLRNFKHAAEVDDVLEAVLAVVKQELDGRISVPKLEVQQP